MSKDIVYSQLSAVLAVVAGIRDDWVCEGPAKLNVYAELSAVLASLCDNTGQPYGSGCAADAIFGVLIWTRRSQVHPHEPIVQDLIK